MGFFSLMGDVLGTDKGLDRTFDTANRVGGWIDRQQYTDEEKAEAGQLKREWGLRHFEALSKFKIAQRILVFSIMFFVGFLLLNLVGAIWFGSKETILHFKELLFSDIIAWSFVSVVSLYTGGGTIESFRKKVKA